MRTIIEEEIKIKAELPKKDVNRKMPIFYNPLMESNRNISILLLNSVTNKNMKIADPLAGSGIRSLRFLKELKKGKIKELFVNDLKDNFELNFTENLTINKINNNEKIKISNQEATLFLLTQEGFDYIDLDPFGTPNPFLSSAIARISRKGILAVTATDTAALTGTYLKVTKRKYWSASLKNYLMHETGLRILIRKVQLQGIQFDKALTPILSYHKDHYFRIYFKSEKGKEKCDQLIKQHQYLLFNPKTSEFEISDYNRKEGYQFAGPLWTGKLFDSKLICKIVKENKFKEEEKFLNMLKEESKLDFPFFYDLHTLAKIYKFALPRQEQFLKKIKAVKTHFSPTGFKSELSVQEIIKKLIK
jgi:tRNA (guanine26-N2/guanine27-N2)-dimethyltransferase